MRPSVFSSSANPGRIQVKFCFISTCIGVDLYVCSSSACGIRALPARSSVGVSSLSRWCRLHLVLLHLLLLVYVFMCFLFRLFVACASSIIIIIQFLGFSGFDSQTLNRQHHKRKTFNAVEWKLCLNA